MVCWCTTNDAEKTKAIALKDAKKKLKEANMKIFNLQEKLRVVDPQPPKTKKTTNNNDGWGSTRGWNDADSTFPARAQPAHSSTAVDIDEDYTRVDMNDSWKKAPCDW